VSGGQAGAENGVLTVMCGGDAAPYAKAEPVIASYARSCRLIGGPGSGQLTKMVNQICIAGLVQGLAEGIHFAKRSKLDVELVLDVISKGAAGSWQMENRGKTMNQSKFDFGSRSIDAQGPVHLPRRGTPQRRAASSRCPGRSVLCRGAKARRPQMGYLLLIARLDE